jgi:hypothetical protein
MVPTLAPALSPMAGATRCQGTRCRR